MKKIPFYCALLCITQLALAQEAPKTQETSKKEVAKASYKTVGSVILSGHLHNETSLFSGFLNFGGPSLRLDYGKYGVSYGMFPSLRFFKSKGQLMVTPLLGTGFQFSYKKIVLALPMYYMASPRTKNNTWIVSVGAGYKF